MGDVENPFASTETVPGSAPQSVSTRAAVFGLLLSVYSIVQIGAGVYVLLDFEGAELIPAVVLIASGGGGLVAGWRLAGRRRAGLWTLVPLVVHICIVVLVALSFILRRD